jgi:hypothetical protein
MKFVQTFWTGKASKEVSDNPLQIKAGWLSSEYHWMSWALSCLQLVRLYGQVELVTDKLGKYILVDLIGLPYTSVSLALEGQAEKIHPKLFAQAKIKTYSLQNEPFIHVDGDLFLYQQFPERILEAGLVSSNPEADLAFNARILREVTEKGFQLPGHLSGLEKEPHLFSSNAGIIGGSDLGFIREYCNHAVEFADKNKELLESVTVGDLNFLFEQISFFYLARQKGKKVNYVSQNPVTDPLYHDFIRVADIPNVPMVHAVAGCKRFPFMLDHLAKRLRLDYPAYYYKIVRLCLGANIPLANRFYSYYAPAHNSPQERVDFNRTANAKGWATEKPLSRRFERTIKTLEYALPELVVPDSLEGFRRLSDDDTLPPQCQDILQIELLIEKAQASVKLAVEGEELYTQDSKQYEETDALYNAGHDVNEDKMLDICPGVQFYEAGWHWWKSGDEAMKETLSENFNVEPDVFTVAIVPDILTLQSYIHYLDALDTHVVGLIRKSPMTIGQLLHRVHRAFDEDIDPDHNSEYRGLIFDTLKRLSFNRVIG